MQALGAFRTALIVPRLGCRAITRTRAIAALRSSPRLGTTTPPVPRAHATSSISTSPGTTMSASSRSMGKLSSSQCVLFVCDIQERFRPVISGMPAVIDIASKMVRCAKAMDIPVIVTEQYPKALGYTVDEIITDLPEGTSVVEKTIFSMVVPEVEELLEKLPHVKQVLLVGIEGHVCVTQTALDLIEKGYEVHLIADGISSQRIEDRAVGLHRMMQAGAFASCFEMASFQMAGHAKHPAFKAISALAKEERPEQLPK
eukprot:CAMPEP_0117670758 /NCGR_PEP_ID=MMETSP0804-20121206/12950_1 /TAXON_ID=1074897 /ORGANISM="Tetraselmis astigmatica, Strain CCMP880" /LENGTH=257 /DNA_ID=CAMNT_0005479131 /DNA_START=333 /DNA_END=1103 /DNA_ORIENTATION=+